MAKRRSSKRSSLEKLTYREQLEKKIKAAWKKYDQAKTIVDRIDARLEAVYYTENLGGVACASWKDFRTSWAGQEWFKREQVKELTRA